MPSLVLYDHPQSSNALKVRFLAAELELDLERRHVPMTRPRPQEYLQLNPLGGIPTLFDGDFVLAESQAILRYLATREGRGDLYPGGVRERGRVDEFLDRFTTRIRPAFFRHEAAALGYQAPVGFVDEERDPAAAQKVAAEIAPEIALLATIVGERGAVLDRFTIADCALAPVLYRTQFTGLDLAPYPKLMKLRASLMSRPAWSAADPVL